VTRIIGGTAGGRRLATPRGEQTRPTSDRVREALFSAVESWCGSLAGLRVLDLYAGSGALGLEALSRGASRAVLVERDRRTAALVSANARELGLAGARVVAASVQTALAAGPGTDDQRHDLVLSDPPYTVTEDDLATDLRLLVPWLAPDALVVVERARRSPEPTWPTGLEGVRHKRYGDTVLWYGHAPQEPPHDPRHDLEQEQP